MCTLRVISAIDGRLAPLIKFQLSRSKLKPSAHAKCVQLCIQTTQLRAALQVLARERTFQL
mgnify:FL=1